jgi:hypothetical protein
MNNGKEQENTPIPATPATGDKRARSEAEEGDSTNGVAPRPMSVSNTDNDIFSTPTKPTASKRQNNKVVTPSTGEKRARPHGVDESGGSTIVVAPRQMPMSNADNDIFSTPEKRPRNNATTPLNKPIQSPTPRAATESPSAQSAGMTSLSFRSKTPSKSGKTLLERLGIR